MSRLIWAILLTTVIEAPASASVLSWSLGSHLGIANISGPKGTGGSTVVAWPSNVLTYQPGVRLAIGNARHTHDLMIDSGMFSMDEAGSTVSLFTVMSSYQEVFMPSWALAPFANLGIGLYREDSATRTHTSSSFGGGIGVRHMIGDRHGDLRCEVRFDNLNPDEGSFRPRLQTVGLRLGFDLWQ